MTEVVFTTPLADEIVTGSPDASATGIISSEDRRFLLSMVETTSSHRIVEVGVAAGASSLSILMLLQRLDSGGQLFSFDIADRFYGDPTKPLAFLVVESQIDTQNRFYLFGGEMAADVPARIQSIDKKNGLCSVDLAFIDAHHCHPWATLDALAIMPVMKPDGWIVLHDIRLAQLRKHGQEFGPEFLFDSIRARKVTSPGPIQNIGAFQLPGDGTEIEFLLHALSKPWEYHPGEVVVRVSEIVHTQYPDKYSEFAKIVSYQTQRAQARWDAQRLDAAPSQGDGGTPT